MLEVSLEKAQQRAEMPLMTGGKYRLLTVKEMGTTMPTCLLKPKPSIFTLLPTHFQNSHC